MSGEEARAETKKVRKTVPKCRFGSRCRTEKCKFIHPDGEVTVAMKMSADKTADQMVVEQPAAVVISEPAPGQGDAVSVSVTVTAKPATKAATTKCRYGAKCRNKACKFVHPPPGLLAPLAETTAVPAKKKRAPPKPRLVPKSDTARMAPPIVQLQHVASVPGHAKKEKPKPPKSEPKKKANSVNVSPDLQLLANDLVAKMQQPADVLPELTHTPEEDDDLVVQELLDEISDVLVFHQDMFQRNSMGSMPIHHLQMQQLQHQQHTHLQQQYQQAQLMQQERFRQERMGIFEEQEKAMEDQHAIMNSAAAFQFHREHGRYAAHVEAERIRKEQHQAQVESERCRQEATARKELEALKKMREAVENARLRQDRLCPSLAKLQALQNKRATLDAFQTWNTTAMRARAAEALEKANAELAIQNERERKEREAQLDEELRQHMQEEEMRRQAALRAQREEFRKQQEQAKEKKRVKKAQRHATFVQEQEQQKEHRAQFWRSDEVAREQKYSKLIGKLCIAEFIRRNPQLAKANILTIEKVEHDKDVNAKLLPKAREAYRVLFQDEVKTRFVVAGLNENLNGRTGTILYWDEAKMKYCVGLDTKRTKGHQGQQQEIFLEPCYMDPNSPEPQSKKKRREPHITVSIPSFFKDWSLKAYSISKVMVKDIVDSMSPDRAIEMLMNRANAEDERLKQMAEGDRQREEEDRQRRAARKAEEEKEWEARRTQYEARKREYEEYRREEAWMEAERREEQRKSWSSRGHFRGGMEGGGGCNCPECRFREALFGSFFGGGRSPEFFFEQFEEDDDSDDWDRRYDEEEDYAREEEDQKAADLIGVDVDAEPDAIKKEYRKLALKYHPDKYRFEKHEDTGMNKDEATEHFKKVQNAYDHLMSNFDD